jgi:hypothetical protein
MGVGIEVARELLRGGIEAAATAKTNVILFIENTL